MSSTDDSTKRPLFGNAVKSDEAEAAEKQSQAKVVMLDARRMQGQTDLEELLDFYDLTKGGDIIELVKALKKEGLINFPHTHRVKVAEGIYNKVPYPKEINRTYLFDLVFQYGKRPCPFNDDFHARFVDQNYNVIDDEYDFGPWVKAFFAAGMKEESHEGVRKSMREWSKGRRRNSLRDHVLKRLPVWDGKRRAALFFVRRFKCKNNRLNKMFSLAFMNQVYRRIVQPGCSAPFVPVLVGRQYAGKSYFASRLVQIIMKGYDPSGRKGVTAIEHKLGSDLKDLMRTVTGNTFVVIISEMDGFEKAEINATKAWVTREHDPMDYKYEGNRVKPRGFVIFMDANKYDGLQRDETGNRRFYPVFWGQGPDDEDGKQTWDMKFELNMDGDEEEVWQILAEVHHYQMHFAAAQRARGRECADDGYYKKLLRRVSEQVFEFNRQEVLGDRGTVHHRATEQFFKSAMFYADKRFVLSRTGSKSGEKLPNRIVVSLSELHRVMSEISKTGAVGDAIEKKVTAMGGRKVSGGGNPVTYQWDCVPHPDPERAAEFAKDRPQEIAATDIKGVAAGFIDEFMAVHFGDDYKETLKLSGFRQSVW